MVFCNCSFFFSQNCIFFLYFPKSQSLQKLFIFRVVYIVVACWCARSFMSCASKRYISECYIWLKQTVTKLCFVLCIRPRIWQEKKFSRTITQKETTKPLWLTTYIFVSRHSICVYFMKSDCGNNLVSWQPYQFLTFFFVFLQKESHSI